jgi:hypothetical protein
MSYLTKNKLLSTNPETFSKAANELSKELSTLFAVRGIEPLSTEVDSSDCQAAIKFTWDAGDSYKDDLYKLDMSMTLSFSSSEDIKFHLGFGWPTWADYNGGDAEASPFSLAHSYHSDDTLEKLGLNDKTINKWARNDSSTLPRSALATAEGFVKRLEKELEIYQAYLPVLAEVATAQAKLGEAEREVIREKKRWFPSDYVLEKDNKYGSWAASWFNNKTVDAPVYIEVDSMWASNGGKGLIKDDDCEVRFCFNSGSITREEFSALIPKLSKLVNSAVTLKRK